MTTKESQALHGIIEGYQQDIKKREQLIKIARSQEYQGILAREKLLLEQVINRLQRFERSGI